MKSHLSGVHVLSTETKKVSARDSVDALALGREETCAARRMCIGLVEQWDWPLGTGSRSNLSLCPCREVWLTYESRGPGPTGRRVVILPVRWASYILPEFPQESENYLIKNIFYQVYLISALFCHV